MGKNGTRIHIVGLGGVGMSALAQALLDVGTSVSGSDRLLDESGTTETLECLRHQGVALYPQNGTGISADVGRVVVSTAIEADNPDLIAARRLGLPVVHRTEELCSLVAGRRLVAVTGTSGKSTVTALLGWLLAQAGLDPLVINGAAVTSWDYGGTRLGSVRAGAGAWAVIEADESDRSLLHFTPEHAIITNRSADHFDLAATERLFNTFRRQVAGRIIEGEPPPVSRLPSSVAVDDNQPQSTPIDASLHRSPITDHLPQPWHSTFAIDGIRFTVPLPGRHNVSNAWQAVRLAQVIGIDLATLARDLATFPGVERRLQLLGDCAGAAVIDDYAHNPAKLTAAWQTVAAIFPRIVALWRPHGYGPLRIMMNDLVETFSAILRPDDRLVIPSVYDAGGTAQRDVNGADLVVCLVARGLPAVNAADLAEAERLLRREARVGTALLICGARDPGLPRLARRLVEPV